MRYALVCTRTSIATQIAPYLPGNYSVLAEGLTDPKFGWPALLVGGKDDSGWTLDDYVLPRLSSGNHTGREITQDEARALYKPDVVGPWERYVFEHGRVWGPLALVRDLMTGDPASFKRGYSLENAILAVADLAALAGDALTQDQQNDIAGVIMREEAETPA